MSHRMQAGIPAAGLYCALWLLASCGPDDQVEALQPPPDTNQPLPQFPAPAVPAPPAVEVRPQVLNPPIPGFYSRFSCLDASEFASIRSYVLGDGSVWTSYGATWCVSGWQEYWLNGFWQARLDFTGATSAGDVRFFGAGPVATGNLDVGTGGTPARLYSDLRLTTGQSVRAGAATLIDNYANQPPALLGSVAGEWRYATLIAEGWSANGNGLTRPSVTVSDDGAVRASLAGGCAATGTMAPHPYSGTVFEIVLTFDTGSCVLAGRTLRGIAAPTIEGTGPSYYWLDIMIVDETRTRGMIVELWR